MFYNFDELTKFQVDMSKCMVAYIDWYHERMDGEGGREKIKVNTNTNVNTNTQIHKDSLISTASDIKKSHKEKYCLQFLILTHFQNARTRGDPHIF